MSRKRLYSPRPLPTGTYCAFILLQMAEPSKSSHELANEKISAAIQEIYKEHPDKGHRRIRDDLEKDYDIQISPKLGTEVGPVFPPRLCDFGVFIVPVLCEGLQIVQSSLLVHCSMVSLNLPPAPLRKGNIQAVDLHHSIGLSATPSSL